MILWEILQKEIKRCSSGRPGSFLSLPRLTPHRLKNKQFSSLSRSVLISPHLSSSKFVFCFLNFQGVEQNCRLIKKFLHRIECNFSSFIYSCLCVLYSHIHLYLSICAMYDYSEPPLICFGIAAIWYLFFWMYLSSEVKRFTILWCLTIFLVQFIIIWILFVLL